jgi:hypothetical protein
MWTGIPFARNIRRTLERANRPLRARHWKAKKGKPLGPKLIRGRGLHRRRRDYTAIFRVVLYLAVAVAVAFTVFRLFVTPTLGW